MRRAALVTGGAHRIGRAIVEGLAQDGWSVAIHANRSLDDAENLADILRSRGAEAWVVSGDLEDPGCPAELMAAATQGGPLHALINNASIFERDSLEDLQPAGFEQHMRTNCLVPMLLIQAFAAQLPAGAAGCVVNLLDQRVWKPVPDFLSYGVSKAALWWLTRTLAQALAPAIRVNGVGPGPVLQSVHQTEEQFARQASAVPLARAASPSEIWHAVRFLLDAPSVTGQMIAVDGGQHLAWATPDVLGVE